MLNCQYNNSFGILESFVPGKQMNTPEIQLSDVSNFAHPEQHNSLKSVQPALIVKAILV